MLKGHFLLNFVCLTALRSFIANFHFDLLRLFYFLLFWALTLVSFGI